MADQPRAAAPAADEPLTTSDQWDHLESTMQPAPRPEPASGGAPEVPALPELEASSTPWDTTASVPPAPEVPGVSGATAEEESWQWASSTAASAGGGPTAASSVPRLGEDLLPTVTSGATTTDRSDLDATVQPAPQPPSSIATLESSLPSLLGTTTLLGGPAADARSHVPASVVAPTAEDLPPLDDDSVLTVSGGAAPPPEAPANEAPAKETVPVPRPVPVPVPVDVAMAPPHEVVAAVPPSPMAVDARREGGTPTAAAAASDAPPLPARPASPPRRIPPRRSGNDLYALKRIRFRDHDFRIVMQNANGPCALIAIGRWPECVSAGSRHRRSRPRCCLAVGHQ